MAPRVGGSASKQHKSQQNAPHNPEIEERNRLKTIAYTSSQMLAKTPPTRSHSILAPSKTVVKHHGKDILKKSQRKNLRFLFSFPGLIAPVGGGKVGELKNLGSRNPVMYLDFPQGRMKLFGTIVYPQNRYLTLQFSRGGKNVICEDCFDAMIVFSEAWWIGMKDQNPEEARLEFPEELSGPSSSLSKHGEHDFKGGAGLMPVNKLGVHKTLTKSVEEVSSDHELEDDLLEGKDEDKEAMEMTPVRHSERTAGKKFKFAEDSSGDDIVGSDDDISQDGKDPKAEKARSASLDLDDEDVLVKTCTSTQLAGSVGALNSKKLLQSVNESHNPQENSCTRGSLVQATISTLFKKVEEKKTPRGLKKAALPKVSGQKSQQANSKRKADKAAMHAKVDKVITEKQNGKGKAMKKDQTEVEDDDIEEFSSSSQGTEESDEDWAA